MEPRSLKYVCEACDGELHGPPDAQIARVCTDSRRVQAGDLFVALTGETFDGHDFVPAAAARGIAAAVIERAKASQVRAQLRQAGAAEGLPCVVVDHTRRALGALAAHYRRDFDLPVFVVGGSNGKTTTKELTAAVLRQKLDTLWSEASFNNDIGVPLTLLQLERRHQVAVVEAGTNHPGELAPLVRLIAPRYAIVPALGREHLEFFGNMDGVLAEEGWLAELLPADGKLFVNGDNRWMQDLMHRSRAPVVTVGLGGTNDWRAENLRLDATGVSFTVAAPRPEWSGEYRVNLLGAHQVVNALLALAAGAELGLKREEMARGLAACVPPKMRMQVWELRGVRVLDDTYNANADSMLASLETLAALPCPGRRIAVLGDMAELGRHTESAHREVGRRAAELKLDALFAVGRLAATTAQAARDAGLADARPFAEAPEAADALRREARAGDVVLLKASRATRLERVTEALRQMD